MISTIYGNDPPELVISKAGGGGGITSLNGDVVGQSNLNVVEYLADQKVKVVDSTNDLISMTVMGANPSVHIGTVLTSAAGQNAVSIGTNSGDTAQGASAVSIGDKSGMTSQSAAGTAIGFTAGMVSQGIGATACGVGAGMNSQSMNGVAVGNLAGRDAQGQSSVAIGQLSGLINMGANSLACGDNAGYQSMGINSVCLGSSAGYTNCASHCICLGQKAGSSGTTSGSFWLGLDSAGTAVGVRDDPSSVGFKPMYVHPTNGEVIRVSGVIPSNFQMTTRTNITSNSNITYTALEVLGGVIVRDPVNADVYDVLPTSASIVNAISNPVIGLSFILRIYNVNTSGWWIEELAAGAGMTYILPLNTSLTGCKPEDLREILFVLTNVGSGTETIDIYGGRSHTKE